MNIFSIYNHNDRKYPQNAPIPQKLWVGQKIRPLVEIYFLIWHSNRKVWPLLLYTLNLLNKTTHNSYNSKDESLFEWVANLTHDQKVVGSNPGLSYTRWKWCQSHARINSCTQSWVKWKMGHTKNHWKNKRQDIIFKIRRTTGQVGSKLDSRSWVQIPAHPKINGKMKDSKKYLQFTRAVPVRVFKNISSHHLDNNHKQTTTLLLLLFFL